MNTSGRGNEALMILVPVGVLVTFGIIMFGGPAEAFNAVNTIVGETVRATLRVVSSLFS